MSDDNKDKPTPLTIEETCKLMGAEKVDPTKSKPFFTGSMGFFLSMFKE